MLIYYHSNTQETIKKQLFQLSAIALKCPANILDCNAYIAYVYDVQKKKDVLLARCVLIDNNNQNDLR